MSDLTPDEKIWKANAEADEVKRKAYRKAERMENIKGSLRAIGIMYVGAAAVVFPFAAYIHNTQVHELSRDLRICEYNVNELNRKVRGR